MIRIGTKHDIVVIGNGMVGCRFCESLIENDESKQFALTVFGEEPRAAYDRVHLSECLSGSDPDELLLKPAAWYEENNITLHVGDPIEKIDRETQQVYSRNGRVCDYDILILATGSSAFVPPIDGIERQGVFPYRTVEDIDKILAYRSQCQTVSFIGGGLLALEAAKKIKDLGHRTIVLEFADRLMARQLDHGGAQRLKELIEAEGIEVQLNRNTTRIAGNGRVERLFFPDGDSLATDMVVVAAGIRPRDELARTCGLKMGRRGGVVVNDYLQTSDPSIYAIGEVALHNRICYGLVGPGYEMADALAKRLCGFDESRFAGSDMSTRLKLAGIEVASFGNFEGRGVDHHVIVIDSQQQGIYKKLVLSSNESQLLGGLLVGDDRDYPMLLSQYQIGMKLPGDPMTLMFPSGGDVLDMPDGTKICSCENVLKGDIVRCLEEGCCTVGEIKQRTKAGTGCGGCTSTLTQLVKAKLKRDGVELDKRLCEHFVYSRMELFALILKQKIKTFDELLLKYGTGLGCEVCKPTVASILASLWNEPVHRHAKLQDTNDAYLANIQRNGSYSVIPRLPGGEITADKLVALGTIAQRYGLYVKLTGAQRIDMLGARVDQLPHIWRDLIDAGFESGQAYAKGLRTVKSCVGQTWCRFGQQDSTALAIELENRYKGLRSPHKLKSAVSGCIRECAEARGKDFGLIATEKGWDLYVCGNGGAHPQHGVLLASDIDKETVIRYLDRFLMFYVSTADKLTRTSTWLNQLEGGIDYLKRVIIDDCLGVCEDLEKRMAHHVATYGCDWKRALEDETFLARFRSFVNSDAPDPAIRFERVRGQIQPV